MTKELRVAVIDDYQHAAYAMMNWTSAGPHVHVTYYHDHMSDPDQLVARLRGFDVIVVMRERTAFPRDLLRQLPSLRLLVTTGRINAAIDVPGARALGIVVSGTNAPAAVIGATELAWALIFAVARGIPMEDAAVRHGGWQVGLGTVLHGKTLGLVGLGKLGSAMPPVAGALGMRVVAWSRNLTQEHAALFAAEPLDREEFFRCSDVVSIHIKLSDRSRGYVGREELALMKPTAFLINTSRGPVVDEDALVDALRRRSIAGAALDVFDQEPLPLHHPLRHLPNTVLSPHMGNVTREAYEDYFRQIVEDVIAYRNHVPIRVLE